MTATGKNTKIGAGYFKILRIFLQAPSCPRFLVVPPVTRPVRQSPRQPPKNAKRRSEKSGCPSIHQTLKTIDLRPTELGNSGSGLYHDYRLHFNKRISGIVESSLQISQGEICNSDGGGSVVVMIYWKLTSSGAEISSFLAYKK